MTNRHWHRNDGEKLHANTSMLMRSLGSKPDCPLWSSVAQIVSTNDYANSRYSNC